MAQQKRNKKKQNTELKIVQRILSDFAKKLKWVLRH